MSNIQILDCLSLCTSSNAAAGSWIAQILTEIGVIHLADLQQRMFSIGLNFHVSYKR